MRAACTFASRFLMLYALVAEATTTTMSSVRRSGSDFRILGRLQSLVHHPDMHAPPPPPNVSSMAERLDALRSCSLVGRARCRSGRAKIPPACACFDTCSKAHLDHLLYRLMPTVVSSRDSPWYQYLLAIYGDALPLPFNMTRLRMLYHADDVWRTRYPQTFWPMSSCIAKDNAAPVHWQPLFSAFGFHTPAKWCQPSVCAQWLDVLPHPSDPTPQVHPPPGSTPPPTTTTSGPSTPPDHHRLSAVQPPWMLIPDGQYIEYPYPGWRVRFARWYAGSDQQLTSAVVWTGPHQEETAQTADHSWVEVVRSTYESDRRPHGYSEGVLGYGLWFDIAPGSGVWINTGSSVRATNELDLFGAPFMRDYLSYHGLPDDCIEKGGRLGCTASAGWARAKNLTSLYKKLNHTDFWQWARGHNWYAQTTLPREVASLSPAFWNDRSRTNEPWPFMAMEIGYSTIQLGKAALYPGVQLVATNRENAINETCVNSTCKGCSTIDQVVRCPAFTANADVCGRGIEYRVGWEGSIPCSCREDVPTILTCATRMPTDVSEMATYPAMSALPVHASELALAPPMSSSTTWSTIAPTITPTDPPTGPPTDPPTANRAPSQEGPQGSTRGGQPTGVIQLLSASSKGAAAAMLAENMRSTALLRRAMHPVHPIALFSNDLVQAEIAADGPAVSALWDSHHPAVLPRNASPWNASAARGVNSAWLLKLYVLWATPFRVRTLFLDADVFVIFPRLVDSLLRPATAAERLVDIAAPTDVVRYARDWGRYANAVATPFCSAVFAYRVTEETSALFAGAAELMIQRQGKPLPGTIRLSDQEAMLEEWLNRHPSLRVLTLTEEWFCPIRVLHGHNLHLTNTSAAPQWSTQFGKPYGCKAVHGHSVSGDPSSWPLEKWAAQNGWRAHTNV